jgi:hypothetical protein
LDLWKTFLQEKESTRIDGEYAVTSVTLVIIIHILLLQVKAYQGAISRLKHLDREITSVDELKGLTGIGPRISKKIEEILRTG